MKKFPKLLSVAGVGIFLSGCSFQLSDKPISDISTEISYKKVLQQGYMGGSLLYEGKNTSASQLSDGVCVAVRLGKVSRSDIDNEQAVFSDIEDEAEYGFIKINSITQENINFTYSPFESDGTPSPKTSFSISLGENADINGDGLSDLSYTKPSVKRLGLEHSSWLTFLSSQTDLNTSMFALLTEQFADNSYPNGLMGINPDGRFLVSKYVDDTGSARSAVSGVCYGDYVLDSKTGSYQRVISTRNTRGARALEDSDLEDLESNGETSWYFSSGEFEAYDIKALYDALPGCVKELYPVQNSIIEVLNSIVSYKDLIPAVKSVREIPIPEEIYEEVLAQITDLTEEELVQLNRTFLEKTYTELCPKLVPANIVYTEILPLVDVRFGGDYEPDVAQVNIGRAAADAETYSDYRAKQISLKNEFDKLNRIGGFEFDRDIETEAFKLSLKNTHLDFGARGKFQSCWGSFSFEGAGTAYVQAEAVVRAGYTIDKNLFSMPRKEIRKSFPIGPVVIDVSAGVQINVPIHAEIKSGDDADLVANVSGLFGAELSAGADYGIRWKKAWIIRYPTPYIDWRSNNTPIRKLVYYVGADTDEPGKKLLSSSVVISPSVTVDAGIGLWNLVNASIAVTPEIKAGVSCDLETHRISSNASLLCTLTGDFGIRAGLDVDLLGWRPMIEKRWPISKYQLLDEKWLLFEKTF